MPTKFMLKKFFRLCRFSTKIEIPWTRCKLRHWKSWRFALDRFLASSSFTSAGPREPISIGLDHCTRRLPHGLQWVPDRSALRTFVNRVKDTLEIMTQPKPEKGQGGFGTAVCGDTSLNKDSYSNAQFRTERKFVELKTYVQTSFRQGVGRIYFSHASHLHGAQQTLWASLGSAWLLG